MTAFPYLFEGHANPVLLDPKDSAVEHNATMLGHKLKPIGNVVWIRHIDSGPISGYIGDTTADAHAIAIYLRGMIDCSVEPQDCSETIGIAGRLERYCRRVECLFFGHLTACPAGVFAVTGLRW